MYAGGGNLSFRINPCSYSRSRCHRRQDVSVNGGQNHYAVLGIASDASVSDIKKAYRLLALKYHPDVTKDPAVGDEAFKSIRLAYEVLSNEETRDQYDQVLRSPDGHRRFQDSWDYAHENRLRVYKWAYSKGKRQHEKFWEQSQSREKIFSFNDEPDETSDDSVDEEERGSFYEVLKSAFLSLFLLHAVGIRLSLTFSSLAAFFDEKLDTGYKIGYLIAWILGGRGGILLTLLLRFASWLCGKTSSSLVALLVVSMWFCSNLARYAPLPQGALLTLLYMSIKLQDDLK